MRRALRGPVSPILVPGVLLGGLLIAFVLLFVNVPAGYNATFGFHLPAVGIFASRWPYPAVELSKPAFTASASGVTLALWVVYLGAALRARTLDGADAQGAARLVLGFACIYNVLLALFLPPVLSGDVFHYALFGRMVAAGAGNPYLVPGDSLRADPFWSLTLWREMTTPYGPAWSLISAFAAMLGRGSVFPTLIVFKCIAAASNVAGAFLVLALARRLGCANPVRALLYYAWNPLVLIESAGSGHNDVVMVALALSGVLLAAHGRAVFGLAVLVLSALVKYLTFLLVAFYVGFLLSRSRGRAAVGLGVRMVMVGGAVVVLLYLPFWPGTARLDGLLPGFAPSFNPAPNPILGIVEQSADGLSIAPIVALLFGAMLIAQLWLVTRPTASWSGILSHYGWATLIYAYFVFGSALPWYLVSPFAAASVRQAAGINRVLILVSSILGLAGFVLGYAALREM